MRAEILGSALAHGGLVAFALIWMGLPQPEDAPAMGSVEVELIGASLVTSNDSEMVESDATLDAVSSGAETSIAPVAEAEIAEAVPPETVQPVTETVEPLPVEEIEPVLAVAALESEDAVAPAESPVLEPETVSEAKMAPVPHLLSFTRPSTPTPRQAATPPVRQQALSPQQAGNGGTSNQDTAAALSSGGQAGAGSGGEADVARYPGQVERKLGRALRYPRDAGRASGEAEVHFVLGANGQILRLALKRSSGNAIIDQAALETVQRAAPYPPFPADAGRAQWEFSIPLNFAR